jgi:hypothetical protein
MEWETVIKLMQELWNRLSQRELSLSHLLKAETLEMEFHYK